MNLDATIARGQNFARSLMTDVCDISNPVTSTDGAGGSSTSYTTAQTAVPCYIAPASRRGPSGTPEAARAGRVQSADDWIVMLPASTTIAPTSRISVHSGRILEVTHIEELRTVELFRAVSCVEVH